jgi:hypothetical protein
MSVGHFSSVIIDSQASARTVDGVAIQIGIQTDMPHVLRCGAQDSEA